MSAPTNPFDSNLLCAFAYFSRRYPDLDLDHFRLLWNEADDLMTDALAAGYDPEDVPGLLITAPPPDITFFRPGRENGRVGLENGSRGPENEPRGIVYTFPGITGKCPADEK